MLLIKFILIYGNVFLRCNFLRYVVLLFLIITTLHCGLHIKEPIIPKTNEGLSVGCLNGMDKTINLYLKGQLSTYQINQVAHCAKMVLTVFKNRVRGRKRSEFTPKELRKFIQDIFLQDQKIRDEFLIQIMRLKKVIIGGSENKLTVSDIKLFIKFIAVVQKEAIVFQPHIKTFHAFYNNKKLSDTNRLEAIEQDLQKSIHRMSRFFKNFSQSYSFSDIRELIKEFYYFVNHNNKTTVNLDQKMEALGAIKQMIVRGSDLVIQPHEWEGFLIGSSYLLSASINYTFLKNQDFILSSNWIQPVSVIYNMVIKFLFLIVKNHPKQLLTKHDFLKVTSKLQEANLMPSGFTNQSSQALLRIIFGQILNVEKQKLGIIELNFSHIEKLKIIIKPWISVQFFLNKFFNTNKNIKKTLTLKYVSNYFSPKEGFYREHDILKNILSFRFLYKEGRVVNISKEIYSKRALKKQYFYKNLTIYNFYYLITVMLRVGYEKGYPKTKGITQQQLGAFFKDFDIIQKDIERVKSKNTQTANTQTANTQNNSSGEVEFIAGNILTPSAKGFFHTVDQPEYLTNQEIIEYLSYATSFVISVNKLEKHLQNICTDYSYDDSKNSNNKSYKYQVDCVRNNLLYVLQKTMHNMPNIKKIYFILNDIQKQAWATALIDIAFNEVSDNKKPLFLVKKNLTNIMVAFYFVETTITRFDTDNNLWLSHQEIISAFPVFKGYLSYMLKFLHCYETDELAPSLYAYTIYNKNLPQSEPLKNNIQNLEIQDFKNMLNQSMVWMDLNIHKKFKEFDTNYWDLYLDRTQLTKVYSAVIKGFLKNQESSPINTCSP